MASILTMFKEGPGKDDAWSMRRVIAFICTLLFGAVTIIVALNLEKVSNPLVALVVLGLPLVGTLFSIFFTTWEAIKSIVFAWKGIEKEGA